MKFIFFKQELGRIPVKPEYWPELFGMNLGLKDSEGNLLTFYKSDYLKLVQELKKAQININDLNPQEIMEHIIRINALQNTSKNHIQLVKYFSKEKLSAFQLDSKSSFSFAATPITVGGVALIKNGHQNCIVMDQNGTISMHPKVRGNIAENIISINHTSLAFPRKSVVFAGSFVHTEEKGWIVENTSGHYGSRVTQMRNFLTALKKTGVNDFDALTVKLWIPLDPKNPGAEEKDYTIIYENAAHFLRRIEKSMNCIDSKEQLRTQQETALSAVENGEPQRTEGFAAYFVNAIKSFIDGFVNVCNYIARNIGLKA